MQKIYQICAEYFTDNADDDLSTDPVHTTCLEKDRLASQPTISRFGSHLDEITMEQFRTITVDSIVLPQESFIFNTPSTTQRAGRRRF